MSRSMRSTISPAHLADPLSVRPGAGGQDKRARAINVLSLAKRVKAKILQASTSEVYGGLQIHPQTESHWGRVNPFCMLR
jgi:hypothetical protein